MFAVFRSDTDLDAEGGIPCPLYGFHATIDAAERLMGFGQRVARKIDSEEQDGAFWFEWA